MSFTPGPWKLSKHCSTLVEDSSGRSIASAGGYTRNTEDTLPTNEANANLIAAAPDMFAEIAELRDRLADIANVLEHCPGVDVGNSNIHYAYYVAKGGAR